MPRLVHLNGPPGVGKSTIAETYVTDNPRALALDVDVIVAMIGGWREHFWDTLPTARGLAAAMAREHLKNGNDVVLPQLVTSRQDQAPYVAAARDSGAEYVQLILQADLDTTVERFKLRAPSEADHLTRHVEQIITDNGGVQLLAKIRQDFINYVATVDASTVVDTTGRTPSQTYDKVAQILR